MPTLSLSGRRARRSLSEILVRRGQVTKVLEALAAAGGAGLTFGELRERFPEGVLLVLEELVANRWAQRFQGLVYGITPQGRARLTPAPPVCVAVLPTT